MAWKLFKFLRWSVDSTKPALNTAGAAIFATDTKRLHINTGSGWVGADSPPVGATYMQFPGKSDPNTLWPNTTWSNISSETLLKGRVPRVEGTVPSGGGNAAASFGSSQDDQMQGHWHQAYDYTAVGSYADTWVYGDKASASSATAGAQVREAVTDGSNGTPRTGSATRDASVTVRIWQRTN